MLDDCTCGGRHAAFLLVSGERDTLRAEVKALDGELHTANVEVARLEADQAADGEGIAFLREDLRVALLHNGELLASLKEVVADATWELSRDIIGRAKALIERIEALQAEKREDGS